MTFYVKRSPHPLIHFVASFAYLSTGGFAGGGALDARNLQPKAQLQKLQQNGIFYLFFKTQKLPLFNDYIFRDLWIPIPN